MLAVNTVKLCANDSGAGYCSVSQRSNSDYGKRLDVKDVTGPVEIHIVLCVPRRAVERMLWVVHLES